MWVHGGIRITDTVYGTHIYTMRCMCCHQDDLRAISLAASILDFTSGEHIRFLMFPIEVVPNITSTKCCTCILAPLLRPDEAAVILMPWLGDLLSFGFSVSEPDCAFQLSKPADEPPIPRLGDEPPSYLETVQK